MSHTTNLKGKEQSFLNCYLFEEFSLAIIPLKFGHVFSQGFYLVDLKLPPLLGECSLGALGSAWRGWGNINTSFSRLSLHFSCGYEKRRDK